MNVITTNCQNCLLCNASGDFISTSTNTPNIRISCRIQPDIIKSLPDNEWENLFEKCPLKNESITITIEA